MIEKKDIFIYNNILITQFICLFTANQKQFVISSEHDCNSMNH